MASRPPLPSAPYVNLLSSGERLELANRVMGECIRSHKVVYVCYFCHHFLCGSICFAHHTRTCARNHSYHWWIPPATTPCSHRWISCEVCARQAILAQCHQHVPQARLLINWARLVTQLILRQQRVAQWVCSARYPCNSVPHSSHVLTFL